MFRLYLLDWPSGSHVKNHSVLSVTGIYVLQILNKMNLWTLRTYEHYEKNPDYNKKNWWKKLISI